MEGSELVRCTLEAFCIIEHRVMVYTYLFSSVLQLPGVPAAVQDLLHLLFRLLIVLYRQ